jgi:hypothetical protein
VREVPEHVQDLLEVWPVLQKRERWQRRWDWVFPPCIAAIIAINFNDGWIGQLLGLVLAFSLGMLIDAARWRRRSFEQLKHNIEGLRFTISMILEMEEDED